MVNVDISNIWGALSLPELLCLEPELAAAWQTVAGDQAPAFLELPDPEAIRTAAQGIRDSSQICLVLGHCGGTLGAKAAINALPVPTEQGPRLLFWGDSLSPARGNEILSRLEGQDFSVIVISSTGEELPTMLSLRTARWILERKYGTDQARKRIYAVTDPEEGCLCAMARQEGWSILPLSKDIPQAWTGLTAAGLLPMGVAGLDVQALLEGARQLWESCALGSFENPLWLHSTLELRLDRPRLLSSFQPGLDGFGAWWRNLAACSGKPGLWGEYPRDLPLIREPVTETLVRFQPFWAGLPVDSQWSDPDGLGYLEGKTWDEIQLQGIHSAICAHADGGIPVITADCGPLCEKTLGALFRFLELSAWLEKTVKAPPQPPRGYLEGLETLLGKPQPREE